MLDIEYTRSLLSEGEKFVDYRDEVVLVIGKSGSGKSALVQYLATDMSKLDISGRDRIVSTDERISSSPNFPILFSYKGHNFYDCPGFHASRDKPHALAAGHFIKKLLDQAKKVKFILVVEYSSITDPFIVEFMMLLEHLSLFMTDFSKFSQSIILVATKVEVYRWGSDEVASTTSKSIEIIAEKLMKIKNSLESPNNFFQGNRSNAIALLSSLIQPNARRLFLFYKPNAPNKFGFADTWFIYSKIRLENGIFNAPYTSHTSAADIPSPHRNAINQLAEKSISVIINQITNIRDNLLLQCDLQAIHSLRELVELKTRLEHKIELLGKSKLHTIKNRRAEQIVSELINVLRRLDVDEPSKSCEETEKQISVLWLLQAFKNNDIDIEPTKWLSEITGSLSVTPRLNTCETFLPYLYLELSKYEVLKNQSMNNVEHLSWADNITDDKEEDVIEFVEMLTESIFTENQELPDPYLIRGATLDQLNNILSLTVKQKVALQPVDGVITVKQNIIILSDVVEALSEPAYTGMNVKLFATDTIFIDCSLEKQSRNITLIAPTIRVIGKQKISLHQPDLSTLVSLEVDLLPITSNTERVNHGGNFLAISMSSASGLTVDVSGAEVDNHENGDGNVMTKLHGGIEKSKTASDVTSYKLYLLAMGKDSFFLRSSNTFLNQVFLTEKLDALYTKHDFFNEMMMFENDYHRLKRPANFIFLYIDLLQRVARYTSRVNQDAHLITDIGKKSLQVLYTAVLARVCSLKRHPQHTLIEDPAQYIETTIAQLKNFNDNNYSKSFCIEMKNYAATVDRKMSLVETLVNMKLVDEVDILIEQAKISLKKSIEDARHYRLNDGQSVVDLKDYRELDIVKKFSNVRDIALITLLGVLYCKQAKNAIQENLSINEGFPKSDEKATDIAEVHDETSLLNLTKEELKKSANKCLKSLEKLILDMESDINEYIESFRDLKVLPADKPWRFEGFKYTLSNSLFSVRGAQASLNANHDVVPTDDVLVDIKSTIDQVEEAINQVIETEAEELEERHKSYKSVKNQNEKYEETKERRLLEKLKSKNEIFEEYRDDYADLGFYSSVIYKLMDKTSSSQRDHDREIRQTLTSMLLNMGKDMTRIKSTVPDKQQVVLGVAKWNLASKMKELRKVLENVSTRFEGEEKFNSLVSQLNDSMTTMIEVCACVENCENQAELDANIVLMNRNGFGFEKPGEELTPSIQHMHLIIQSSIVLEKFKSCVDALDGSQFWLTGSTSPSLDFDLQKEFKPKQDIHALIKEAMDKISDFTVKIKN